MDVYQLENKSTSYISNCDKQGNEKTDQDRSRVNLVSKECRIWQLFEKIIYEKLFSKLEKKEETIVKSMKNTKIRKERKTTVYIYLQKTINEKERNVAAPTISSSASHL